MEHDGAHPTLDLVFALDCTSSMGNYILKAKQCIQNISENLKSVDIKLALVEYRDFTYDSVTTKHEFTSSIDDMVKILSKCIAAQGHKTDRPEAVADALHDILTLEWRKDSTKICILITDAPPHGLVTALHDNHPKVLTPGCENEYDPMVISRQLAPKGIVVYTVGCEPNINPYRDWFKALARITHGHYIPLKSAKELAKAIRAGLEEELSLKSAQRFVRRVVPLIFAATNSHVTVETLTKDIHASFIKEGETTKQASYGCDALTDLANALSTCSTMAEAQCIYKDHEEGLKKAKDQAADIKIKVTEISKEQVRKMVSQAIDMHGLTIKELTPVENKETETNHLITPPLVVKWTNTDTSPNTNKGTSTDNISLSIKGTNTDIVYAIKATNTDITNSIKSTNTERVPVADKEVNTDPIQRCPFKILHSYCNGCPFFHEPIFVAIVMASLVGQSYFPNVFRRPDQVIFPILW